MCTSYVRRCRDKTNEYVAIASLLAVVESTDRTMIPRHGQLLVESSRGQNQLLLRTKNGEYIILLQQHYTKTFKSDKDWKGLQIETEGGVVRSSFEKKFFLVVGAGQV